MRPEFRNTPVSPQRPDVSYQPGSISDPLVSIITVYQDVSGVFWETVRSVLRMTWVDWEWLIVDNGSTSAESLAQLDRATRLDGRIRVLRQAEMSFGMALNRAALEAQGRYLLRIDADEMIEPTFVEKATWLLETQPQFTFCNAWSVGFEQPTFLWREGFGRQKDFLVRNWVQPCAVIRRDVFMQAEGFDETAPQVYADWSFWLRLANAGCWGYTLPEFLLWTRHPIGLGPATAAASMSRADREQFNSWWGATFGGLRQNFPKAEWAAQPAYAELIGTLPFTNRIQRKPNETRVLLLLDALELSGGSKFWLDLIHTLSQRGYRFSIVTSRPSEHRWYQSFASLTPDLFAIDHFLNTADYPRFLSYLIESRGIDAVLLSNSEVGYLVVPYLQASYPELAFIDYNFMENPDWQVGGYPSMAVRLRPALDRHVVASNHLRRWMLERGVDASRLHVVRTNVDVDAWNPALFDRPALRGALGVADETPIILYPVMERRRPQLVGQLVRRLHEERLNFVVLVAGGGEANEALQRYLRGTSAAPHVTSLGIVSNDRVQELLAAIDVLLLPSEHEGIAAVLFEAMAMEVVPVAADVGGQSELVTAETGVLVEIVENEAAEVERYLNALRGLLTDPLKRNIMKKRARRRVVESFNMQQSANLMERTIRDMRTQSMHRTQPALSPEQARYMTHLAVESLRKSRGWQLPESASTRFTAAELQESRAWRAAWKLVRLWWWLKLRLMPLGSRRLRWYERYMNRLWRNSGTVS